MCCGGRHGGLGGCGGPHVCCGGRHGGFVGCGGRHVCCGGGHGGFGGSGGRHGLKKIKNNNKRINNNILTSVSQTQSRPASHVLFNM